MSRDPHQDRIVRAHANAIYVLHLQGAIFFGTANTLYERLRQYALDHNASSPQFVVLDFAHVTGLDSTGLLSFRKMRQLAQERELVLVLTGLSESLSAQFVRSGFGEDPPVLRIFGDLDHGLEWCENELIAAHGATSCANGLVVAESDSPQSLKERLQAILRPGTPVERLINALQRREVAAGEQLIRQGDDPDLSTCCSPALGGCSSRARAAS